MDVSLSTDRRTAVATAPGPEVTVNEINALAALSRLRAADLVRTAPTVQLDDGVAAALDGVERGGVVVVLDSTGICRGIIGSYTAERAVLHGLLLRDGPAAVGELPLRRPAAVGPDTPLGAIAWTLSMTAEPAVPVADTGGHHLGVITAKDVLRRVAHALNAGNQ